LGRGKEGKRKEKGKRVKRRRAGKEEKRKRRGRGKGGREEMGGDVTEACMVTARAGFTTLALAVTMIY